MKKMILATATALTLILTACGGSDSTPTNGLNYSGTYDGNMTYLGTNIISFSGPVTQQGSVLTGTVTANSATDTFTGNVTTGVVTITDPVNSIDAARASCTGSWSGGNRYDGTCKLVPLNNSGAGVSGVNLVMIKR